MTVSSGFFNSKNHDRLYDAEQVSSIFDGVIIDGVFENYGDAFNITAFPDANSTVIVGTGRAWFDHTWTLNDSQFAITMDPPNEMLGRIDAIVLDIDRRKDVRKNSIIYIKGDEASSEFPPELLNEDLHKQYPLAYITRHAGSDGPVDQKDIEITVGKGCPIVTSVLEAQNLDNLWQQLDDEFNDWWDGIKAVIDDNAVTNLQNQINEINEQLNSESALTGLLEKPIANKFKTGNFGINVSSYNVSSTTDDFTERTANSILPMITLLPDGKAVLIRTKNLEASNSSGIQFDVFITDTSGVTTHFSDAPTIPAKEHTYLKNAIFDDYVMLLKMEVDSYPVRFYILAVGKNAEREDANIAGSSATDDYPGAFIETITITSSGVVQFSHSDSVISSHVFFEYGNSQYMQSVNCLPMQNGTKIFSFVYSSSRGVGITEPNGTPLVGWTWKITSNMVLSGGVATANGYVRNITDNNLGNFTWYPNSTTDFRYYYTPTNWTSLDASTLEATVHTENTSTRNDFYEVDFPAETYSGSEINGFSKRSTEKGGSNSGTLSKISQLFLGANNSNSALPEGDYIGKITSGRFVGVGPSGEQIAIGSNGGMAMLKAKKTIGTTIDFSKIVKWGKGMVDVGNTRYYLIGSLIPTFNFSAQEVTFKVIKIPTS